MVLVVAVSGVSGSMVAISGNFVKSGQSIAILMPATNLPKANMGLIKVCALHLQVWKRKLEAAKQKGDPAEIKRCVSH